METKRENNLQFISVLSLAVAVLLGILFVYYRDTREVAGAAVTNLGANLATSSTAQIGPQQVLTLFPFATSTICTSRVIATGSRDIALSFATNSAPTVTPSGQIGARQAASTTVSYDSDIYGCGRVDVFGYGVTTTVTIWEFH